MVTVLDGGGLNKQRVIRIKGEAPDPSAGRWMAEKCCRKGRAGVNLENWWELGQQRSLVLSREQGKAGQALGCSRC